MDENKISVRYSKSIYLLAREKDLLDVIRKDFQQLQSVLKSVKEFTPLNESPIITITQKQNIYEKLFQSKFHELTMHFILLIIQNKREVYLKDIIRNFFDLYREGKGIKKVSLISAQPVDLKTKVKLSNLLQNYLGDKIELSEGIEPDIIGGFILRIDDKQYDASTSTQLFKIKRELLKK